MAAGYWDKITAQRVSRRRVLQSAGVAGAAAGAVWLVGCGGGSSNKTAVPGGTSGATAAKGTPKQGGTYRVGSTADFDTFDPYRGIAASVGYFPRLYNVLVNYSALDANFRFDDLSTKYENPDPTTYIFSIRDGVKVGPNPLGVPERALDASDIIESYSRVLTLKESNAYGFLGKWMESQTASPDNKTYTFKSPKPYAYFQNRIGSPINTIVPKEALSDANVEKLKQQAAGAGAFSLKSYTEGQGAELVRNPNYYRKDTNNNNAQLPYIDGLSVKIITVHDTLLTAFQSDQLDTYSTTDVNQSNSIQQGHNYTVVKDPVNTFIAFTMNPTKKPWDDDRIRKAASLAINRKEYIDRVYQGEAKANGLVHWPQGDLALSDDELEKYQPYDPKQARELIKAATGNDSIDITIMYPADSDIEQHKLHKPIFMDQMKSAGFNVKEDPQSFGTWLDNYTKINYDASLSLNQVYEYAEFNMDFQHSEGPARNNIYTVGTGKLDPSIDAEIDRVKTLTNHEEFVKGMHDLQVKIYEKGPSFLPLVSPYSFTLFQPRVKQYPQGTGASALYVNDWYLEA